MKYCSIVLPDADVIAQLDARGDVIGTDVDDAACETDLVAHRVADVARNRTADADSI